MSHSDDAEPADETDEQADIYVADPDDYAKTRKLKAINDAKENYKEYITNETKVYDRLADTWANPEEAFKHNKAEALALYGSELLPLVEQGLDGGALSEEDLKVETDRLTASIVGKAEMDIRKVVDNRGLIWANDERQSIPHKYQDRIYRQLERIEGKLGLGLSLESDDTNEWEV